MDPDRTFAEFDETNNQCSLGLGGVDLSVALDSFRTFPDGPARAVVTVWNHGTPESAEAEVSIRIDVQTGDPIARASVPPLQPGLQAQIAVDLGAGSVPFGETLFRCAVDEDGALDDADRTDNSVGFVVIREDGGTSSGFWVVD